MRSQEQGKTAGPVGDINVVYQQTLKNPISCSGVSLHSGAKVSMTLRPAKVDEGIVFVRTGISGGGARIPATWDHVVDTTMCTKLGNKDGVTVGTVEHLMAAIAGCQIDNLIVEINGPEVPVMDGSAQPFVFLIECAGVVEQRKPRRVIRVLKEVSVRNKGRIATLFPGRGFSMGFEIEFDNNAVARQSLSLGLMNGAFKEELSRARTFGFLHEAEKLWALGLAKGASLENAVVLNGDKILNKDGLRYEDEFVRHKALDAFGDLYLAGAPLIGRFHGVCTGHSANNQLLRALFADKNAWTYDVLRVDEAEVSPHVLAGMVAGEPAAAATA